MSKEDISLKMRQNNTSDSDFIDVKSCDKMNNNDVPSSKLNSNHKLLSKNAANVKNSERKRLYSWSRPTREMRRAGANSGLMKAEHVISGGATIVFPPSLIWFQGNIINKSGDAYTIHGKQRRDSQNSTEEGGNNTRLLTVLPEEELSSQQQNQERRGGSCCQEDEEVSRITGFSAQQAHSSSSLDEESSVCDSLDSALVESAMARLSLELGSEFLFNVTVTDYETGLEHEIKEVQCSIDRENLRLEHDQLQFTSVTALKGMKADTVIASKIGPGLVEKGLTVYSGNLRMTYHDEPCYPVALEASQWCL
eukprot:TRINITY_DN14497_c0_g1_i2.p1 TRINITY_DN14497_c0_g1~~TRINITY_DN14497_c0_g1_i2.p1  ORF type:complete len:309 (-),score=76.97 TRINITY_DN14497_c0_g1_i2:670-1596(-)